MGEELKEDNSQAFKQKDKSVLPACRETSALGQPSNESIPVFFLHLQVTYCEGVDMKWEKQKYQNTGSKQDGKNSTKADKLIHVQRSSRKQKAVMRELKRKGLRASGGWMENGRRQAVRPM